MSYAGLGAGSDSATITITTRTLQQMLGSRGFDPGPADGTWGARTESAVRHALGRRNHGLLVKGGGTSVVLSEATWSAIKTADNVTTPEATPERVPSKPMEPSVATEGGTEWVPWALGSVALLGLAGFITWTGRKR